MRPTSRQSMLRLTTLLVVLAAEILVAGHAALGLDEHGTRLGLLVAQLAASAFLVLAGLAERKLRSPGAVLIAVVGSLWAVATVLRSAEVLDVGLASVSLWSEGFSIAALAAATAGVVNGTANRRGERAAYVADVAVLALGVLALVALGVDGATVDRSSVAAVVAGGLGVVLVAASLLKALISAGGSGVLVAAAGLGLGLVPAIAAVDGRSPVVLADVGAFTGLAAFGLSSLWTRFDTRRVRGVVRVLVVITPVSVAALWALSRSIDGDLDSVVAGALAIATAVLALRRLVAADEREQLAAQLGAASEQLAVSQERFRVGFAQAPVGMLLASPEGALVEVNDALASMLGATTDALERRALPDLVDGSDRAAVGQLLAWARRGQLETSHAELSLIGLDGRRVSATVMVGMVQDGDRRFVLALVEDRTAQRALSERLAFAERYDELTGLLRRAAFVEELGRVIRTPRVTGLLRKQPWVLALDLDGFTEVNDGLGHTAGDIVLTTVAERLRSALRGDDLLARIGADEFAVLVQDSNDAEITVLAERLVRSTTAPVPTPSGELFLSMSVGAAGVWTDDVSPEDVLRNADTALHRAKSAGRGRVELHRAEQRQDASKRVRTGNELHRAIERREFLVYYQPIIDLVTGCLKGFEALVRWQHPERGIVGPGEFIDLAEATGLIVPLGQQVMDEALRRVAQWRASASGDERATLTMSVNLSTRQLAHPDIIAMVRQSLDASGVDPTAVILELTESAIMSDQATARAAMIALRATGARLAIDDFGTGYSSLSYLQQFPVSVLKIDRGFVRGLGTVAGDTAICEAVIRLGHSLGLAIVAEGIEDDLQHRRLHELGCDFGQGFLFGRPLSQAQVEAAFERRSVFGPIWALRPDRSV